MSQTATVTATPYHASPHQLLAQATAITRFNNVPVMVLDNDRLPGDPAQMDVHINAIINRGKGNVISSLLCSASIDPEDTLLPLVLQNARNVLNNKIKFDRAKYSQVLSYALCATSTPTDEKAHTKTPETYEPVLAAVVIPPSEKFMPHLMLRNSFMDVMPGDFDNPPIDNTALRFYILHHELAHVAGADEPQADAIAALFTRRAFPGDPAPQIMADIRAVNSVRIAAMHHLIDPALSQKIIGDLEDYGWPMVESNDAILALPQEEIDTMTDDDIIAHRFDNPSRDNTRLMKLGECYNKITANITNADGTPVAPPIPLTHGHNSIVLSKEIEHFTAASNLLLDNIGKYCEDPAIHAMLKRTALATQRLEAQL